MPRFPHKQRVFSPSPVLSRLIPSFSNTLSPYSKLLGITEGNARLRLTRMRKQLKTYLTEQEVLV